MAGCPPTAAELAQIRADVAAVAFDTPCTIERKASTRDSYGTSTEVYSAVSTLDVGMATPTATELQIYDYLIGSLRVWKVKFPYGTDVRVQDHLVIGSDTMVVQADLSVSSYSSMVTMLVSEVK